MMFKPLNAVILAAGRCAHLQPLTDSLLIFLLSLHGTPILEYILGGHAKLGFKENLSLSLMDYNPLSSIV